MAIERRGNHWRARLRLQGNPQVSKTFDTKAAAEAWESQMRDAAKLGVLPDVLAAETTFAAMARLYGDKVVAHQRGSVQALRRLAQLERGPLGGLYLSSINRKVLRDLRDRRLRTICGGSWNRECTLILGTLKFAVAEHDCRLDPRALLDGLRAPEMPGRRGRISPEAEAKLVEAAGAIEPWAPAMVKLSLALATRRTELFNVAHADINRQTMTVHVKGTKTRASDRVLPISAATLAVIDSLPRSLECDRIFWQVDDPYDMTHTWRKAARRAGLPAGVVLHLARHEALSRLSEAGADLLLLRAYSGHSSLKALGIYARPAATGLRSMIA